MENKKLKAAYWVTTGLFSLLMAFSAYNYFTNPEVAAGFLHLGFPSYFRVELGIMKLIGVAVLLIPQVPVKFKEWAYAGFLITLASAAVSHSASGDAVSMVIMPIVFMLVLLASNYLLGKTVAQG
jgi:hypothetical protein